MIVNNDWMDNDEVIMLQESVVVLENGYKFVYNAFNNDQ